jgi:hypothetical protein
LAPVARGLPGSRGERTGAAAWNVPPRRAPTPSPPRAAPRPAPQDEGSAAAAAMAAGKCILRDGPEEPLLTFADDAVRNVVQRKAANATFHIDGGWGRLAGAWWVD